MLAAPLNHWQSKLPHKFLKCPRKAPRASQNPYCSPQALPTSGWWCKAVSLRGHPPGKLEFALGEKDQSCWVAYPVICALTVGQEKQNKAGRRTKQPSRWRQRRGNGSSWGTQAAGGSCSCSRMWILHFAEVNSIRLLLLAPRRVFIIDTHPTTCGMVPCLNQGRQLTSKMPKRTYYNAKDLPYLGDIPQIGPKLFTVQLKLIYFDSALTAK